MIKHITEHINNAMCHQLYLFKLSFIIFLYNKSANYINCGDHLIKYNN